MDNTKYSATVQSWIKTIEENYRTDPNLALMYSKDLIGHAKETGEDGLVALGYYHKGVIHYIQNEGELFLEAITEAVSHLSIVEEWELLARCYNFLGIFSVNHGNVSLGMDYYLSAIKACESGEIEGYKATVLVNLGALDILYERYEEAIEALELARDYFEKHPEHPRYEDYMICVYGNLAKAYLCMGEMIEAKCCFENIYAEHGEFLDTVAMVTIWATEAMYYHANGKDKKCEDLIARIYENMTDSFPVMDIFDDLYDYCKMLLERDKKDELWKVIDILEPNVMKLDIPNLILKTLSLKLEYYRKNGLQTEYLQTAGTYYEYTMLAGHENIRTMNSVLNLRKALEQLNQEKAEMEAKNAYLEKKSQTDALTGLNNRFGFNEYSEVAFQKTLEEGTSLAVEILDLDNFKPYNDTYGHQRGDECLQNVANAIKSMEEFGAYTARYGGDEFILIYEDKTKEEIVEYAAELRKRVMDLHIEQVGSNGTKLITISQGICWDIPVKGNRVWDYLHAADDMLYRVKQRKRNNFCIGNLTEASEQIIMSYL